MSNTHQCLWNTMYISIKPKKHMTSILTADMGKNPISYSLLSIQPPPKKKNPPGFDFHDIQLCFSTPGVSTHPPPIGWGSRIAELTMPAVNKGITRLPTKGRWGRLLWHLRPVTVVTVLLVCNLGNLLLVGYTWIFHICKISVVW